MTSDERRVTSCEKKGESASPGNGATGRVSPRSGRQRSEILESYDEWYCAASCRPLARAYAAHPTDSQGSRTRPGLHAVGLADSPWATRAIDCLYIRPVGGAYAGTEGRRESPFRDGFASCWIPYQCLTDLFSLNNRLDATKLIKLLCVRRFGISYRRMQPRNDEAIHASELPLSVVSVEGLLLLSNNFSVLTTAAVSLNSSAEVQEAWLIKRYSNSIRTALHSA